jgi:hypothetical protein
MKRLVLPVIAACAALAVAGSAQAAASPAVGQFQTSWQFVVDDLSAACGFTITLAGCDSVKWLHRDGGKWPLLPTRRGVVTQLSGPGR